MQSAQAPGPRGLRCSFQLRCCDLIVKVCSAPLRICLLHSCFSILHEDPGPVTDIMGGAASNGFYLLQLWKKAKEHKLLEAAYGYGDLRHNPTQCFGLASSGDLLLELWRVTRENRWLDRALEFGELVLNYRATLPEGDAWPTDEPGLYSADFMCGGSGTGHFLLRLETQGSLSMPLMGNPNHLLIPKSRHP